MKPMNLVDFVRESNRIEGIHREPTRAEILRHTNFLNLHELTVADVEGFVSIYQPDAMIRKFDHLNVRVGDHIPPQGGPHIVHQLGLILHRANTYRGVVKDANGAYQVHQDYETLHPFTDGNGRSGRAVWHWQMRGHAPLGFLHHWYYQSLQCSRDVHHKLHSQEDL